MLKIVNDTVPLALQTLGYSELEIEQICNHIERYDTIEDVRQLDGLAKSGLKSEHLPIFDCAFKAHHGTRSIHYKGHLGALEAASPFLSGGISKSVNLPESATVEDIVNTYLDAWKRGIKCVAIYRDGSKRSAPLNVKKNKDMGTVEKIEEIEINPDKEPSEAETHLQAAEDYIQDLLAEI